MTGGGIEDGTVFERLLKVRYLAVIIVVFSFLNAIGFIVLGAIRAVGAYIHIIRGEIEGEARPGLEMLEAMDVLFIALMFVIFTAGIAKVFLIAGDVDDKELPVWLRIKSFSELKLLLWETGLTALFILHIPIIVSSVQKLPELTWNLVIAPVVVLLMALSMYIVKKGH
jgi:uncharacterized membrane protein YqhA